MKPKQFDRLIQAIVGIAAIIILAFLVVRGELDATAVVPLVGAVLAAFGFYGVGRVGERKRRR